MLLLTSIYRGHASENPRLPEQLAESKILFIGPPGSAMRSLGDKISSTIVAQHADVPCMPWSGSGITETVMSDAGFLTVSDEVYARACIHSAEEGLAKAETIGYPVMIKASEGGGGKGIRMCNKATDFSQLYTAVLGEVPGSPVFVMKLAGKARHLEVQLMADQYGNAISIFGRDCSVQRRHQKIIEEAPVTIANDQAREDMEKAAVRLAKLVGYVSAGTVEWLYSPETGDYSFLELNPRLQVEHPTTEMVSGVNIPAAQLQVAMGIPLYRIRDIRTLYGMDPKGSEKIDFDFNDPGSFSTQRKPQPKGHVVACRITAENPDTGFKPGMGALTELNFRSSTSTWGYFSVASNGALHEYADSQFGHVFAYGSDRSEARKQMVISLKELSIRGDFRTTVEYLIKLLETDAFEKNTITTGWLDGLIQDKLTAERPPKELAIIAGAAVKAFLLSQESITEYKTILNKGQVPPRGTLKTVFAIDFIYEGEKFNFTTMQSSAQEWTLYLNGGRIRVSLRPLSDGGLLVGLAGKSHPVYWREEVGMTRLMIDGKTCLIEQENDPTQIRSPSPGKLVRFLVESGDHVASGQAIAEIEVMKMYLPLTAAEDGMVTFLKQPGVSLSPGDVIGILSLDDPSRVQHAKPFGSVLRDHGLPVIIGNKPHQRLEYLVNTVNHVLDGFDESYLLLSAVPEMIELLRDPELPYSQANAVLSTLSGRIPSKLQDLLRHSIDTAHQRHQSFPAARLRKLSENFVRDQVQVAVQGQILTTLAPLLEVFDQYTRGLQAHELLVLADFLKKYYAVESLFPGEADRVLALRAAHPDDLDKVVALQYSHNGTSRKNALIIAFLDKYVKGAPSVSKEISEHVNQILLELAGLQSKESLPVALKARAVSIEASLPSLKDRSKQMETILKASTMSASYGGTAEIHNPVRSVLHEVTDSPYSVFDVLHSFFTHPEVHLAYAALATYILRAYRAYDVGLMSYDTVDIDADERALATWSFSLPQDEHVQRKRVLHRTTSDPDFAASTSNETPIRQGAMTSCDGLATLPDALAQAAQALKPNSTTTLPTNVINIAMTDADGIDEKNAREVAIEVTQKAALALTNAKVSRVTYLLCREGQYPFFSTVRLQPDNSWAEEVQIRNIEPALAYQLELERLTEEFEIARVPVPSSAIHLFYGRAKSNPSDCRFFVRSLVRPGKSAGDLTSYLFHESSRMVTEILDVVELAMTEPQYRNADSSHIFMTFIYNMDVTLDNVKEAVTSFVARYAHRFVRMCITSAEVRIPILYEGKYLPVRAFVHNRSAYSVQFGFYTEVDSPDGRRLLHSLNEPNVPSPRHGQSAFAPQSAKVALQSRRSRAHALQTTFAYDFIDVLRQALRGEWKRSGKASRPSEPVRQVHELVLSEAGELQELHRGPGLNKISMVAWRIEMLTPEYPEGREMVLIANDVTLQAGSFGPKEDQFFAAASQLARVRGIPRLYVSANSGARIGVATEILNKFSVKWVKEADPAKGWEYLYLDETTYAEMEKDAPGAVLTEPKAQADGSIHHVITDIIGLSKNGLGVECLSGSGLIAGETSRARDEIFTATIVTGRSVGIGAYLARLGDRVIQVTGSPLILTGYQALNKLLGREVYTSNLQLGGPQSKFLLSLESCVCILTLTCGQSCTAMASPTCSPRMTSKPWFRRSSGLVMCPLRRVCLCRASSRTMFGTVRLVMCPPGAPMTHVGCWRGRKRKTGPSSLVSSTRAHGKRLSAGGRRPSSSVVVVSAASPRVPLLSRRVRWSVLYLQTPRTPTRKSSESWRRARCGTPTAPTRRPRRSPTSTVRVCH